MCSLLHLYLNCLLKYFFGIVALLLYLSIISAILTAPRPPLGHWQGASLTQLTLIIKLYLIWSKGHRESCNVVGSQSLAKHSRIPTRNPLILKLTHYPTTLLNKTSLWKLSSVSGFFNCYYFTVVSSEDKTGIKTSQKNPKIHHPRSLAVVQNLGSDVG